MNVSKKKISLLELIEEAKNSKQQAQSRLVYTYWNNVKTYILSFIKNEQTAEELSVIVFTKALQKLSLYNPDFDFTTWLNSIAHNATIDYLRKANKNQNVSLEENIVEFYDIESSPEQIFINRQNSESFEKMVNKLSPQYQTIIKLRFIEDKKLSEIAQEMGISLTNVKVSLMRAKKLLMEIQKSLS